MRDYYDSPLHWDNVEIGKAYVEKYLGDVVRIIKKSEDNYDDYIHVELYDASAYDMKDAVEVKRRKLTDESWLMIGFADWEEVEIPYKEFHRAVIRSFIRKYMEPYDYDKTVI